MALFGVWEGCKLTLLLRLALLGVWEGIDVCGCVGRQMEGNDNIEQNGKNYQAKSVKNDLQIVWKGMNACGCVGRQIKMEKKYQGKSVKNDLEAQVLTLTRA